MVRRDIGKGVVWYRALVYAVATNGAATSYDLGYYPGILADQILIIPTNQDLYCLNYVDSDPAHSRVLKIDRSVFTNYVGDILVEQAGESPGGGFPPTLTIVRWDSTNSTFLTRSINLNSYYSGHLEHIVFAPINIPSL